MMFHGPLHNELLSDATITYSVSLAAASGNNPSTAIQPSLEAINLDIEARAGELSQSLNARLATTSVRTRASQYRLERAATRNYSSALEYEVELIGEGASPATSGRSYFRPYSTENVKQLVGVSFRHFLPQNLYGTIDPIIEQVEIMEEALSALQKSPSADEDASSYLVYLEQHLNYNPNISRAGLTKELPEEFKTLVIDILRDALLEIAPGSSKQKRVSTSLRNLEHHFTASNMAKCYGNLDHPAQVQVSNQLRELDEELREALHNTSEPLRLVGVRLPDPCDWATSFINQTFTSAIKYLGPLRDEPKPLYPLSSAADSKGVGYRGEYTAAVLEHHRNTRIKYISPSQFLSGSTPFDSHRTTLANAVLEWLTYMGVATGVQTEDMGKLGYGLKVKTDTNAFHELIHVGVGVSQVLPILVLALLADAGSTLVFEQPELHLHPRVQSRLADFFISMTMLGKQCIVETHSEYLINRLRYQVAISEGEKLSDSVQVYFVSKKGGYSEYRDIQINRYGAITDWPSGFFDESEANSRAILKAAMEKRKQEGDRK